MITRLAFLCISFSKRVYRPMYIVTVDYIHIVGLSGCTINICNEWLCINTLQSWCAVTLAIHMGLINLRYSDVSRQPWESLTVIRTHPHIITYATEFLL